MCVCGGALEDLSRVFPIPIDTAGMERREDDGRRWGEAQVGREEPEHSEWHVLPWRQGLEENRGDREPLPRAGSQGLPKAEKS